MKNSKLVTITVPRAAAEAAWEAMGAGLRSPDGARQSDAWKQRVLDVRTAIDIVVRTEDG